MTGRTTTTGTLELQDILDAYDGNAKFKSALEIIEVDREDILNLFNVFDDDHDGRVSYTEFINELHDMKTEDAQIMLVYMKAELHIMQLELQNLVSILKPDAPLPSPGASHSAAALQKASGFQPASFSKNGATEMEPLPVNKMGVVRVPSPLTDQDNKLKVRDTPELQMTLNSTRSVPTQWWSGSNDTSNACEAAPRPEGDQQVLLSDGTGIVQAKVANSLVRSPSR